MRHMLLAATGKKHLPRDEAAGAVVEEWLNAWNNPTDMTAVAAEMRDAGGGLLRLRPRAERRA